MNKVYLVIVDQGAYDDYHWWIDSIYSTPEKAENRKVEISKKNDLIKLDYLNKFGSPYDEDNNRLYEISVGDVEFNEQEYLKLSRRLTNFDIENPQIRYNKIEVEEKEVL